MLGCGTLAMVVAPKVRKSRKIIIKCRMPPSIGFTLVRSLIRLLLAVFYRRIEVVGAHRIPAGGGLIVAANHHNSVVDAMILLAVVPRRLRTLANAPLFNHWLIGPFLRMLGALPVHRRQESGDDPRKNDALFEATTRTLSEGGAIVIFPEGRTQPEPLLRELRTGTARMLLAAAPSEVALLPVGLVFEKPGSFREGHALVLIGEPIATQEIRHLARSEPEQAARRLTEQLARELRQLIIEARDLETLAVLEVAEGIWNAPGAAPRAGVERVRWLQAAAEAYASQVQRAPERLTRYVRRLQRFAADLDGAGLTLKSLGEERSAARATRFALRQAFHLLVGAPLALCGFLIHGLPYALVGLAVRLIPHGGEEEATDKIAAGFILYPLCWALEGWLAWRYGGGLALGIFLALLVPAGFVALSWRERLARVEREVWGLARRLREPGLIPRLRDERDDLLRELQDLAAEAGQTGRATK
jgi:glycerol-3-phosphate O-acyltransferase / dihydroxyacetone phosphate acyltransferase